MAHTTLLRVGIGILVFFVVASGLLFFSQVLHAEETYERGSATQSGGGTGVGQSGGGTGVGQSGGGNTVPSIATLKNPLGNVTITQFFVKIIDIVLIFAVPIIVLFIILAGFKYVTAGGNASKISEATTALTWSLIGGVLILGAKILLTIVENTVNSLKS